MLGSPVGDWLLHHAWYIAPVPATVLVVGLVLASRAKAAITRMNYMCCPRCLYDLSATETLPTDPGAVRCPECGELWGVEAVQDKWKERLFLKIPPGMDGGG
ncbi:MAG TPA: hypothetical protein VHN77_07565 [Phycisphaerales bacterium]|nr:hypothetical protein [Phycisphaerales bacterium]